MPYFIWRGIDLTGSIRRGRRFARTQNLLEKHLLREEIALLSARLPRISWVRPLPRTMNAELCEQLATLLEAGLRLAEALDIVSTTIHHKLMGAIMEDCGQAVREGIPLDRVLSCHVPLVDALMVSLVGAGQESGALARTFKMLSTHYTMQEELAKKCRSALIMPSLTFAFFILITLIIFISVIPRFESLFVMLNKPVPGITQSLFALSLYIRTGRVVWAAGAWTLIFFGVILIWQRSGLKKFKARAILAMPLMGKIVTAYSLTFFLQALTVLLEGGVHLVKAISIARKALHNDMLKEALEKVERDVETGVPLSSAFGRYQLVKSPELESLFAIGEATGSLAAMVHKAAQLYHKKAYRALGLIATLIPPLVLIMLGLVIGVLIFAVYTPLLTLSRVIG